MTPLERHKAVLAGLPCLVCQRLGVPKGPVELHHVAEGSGLRSPWALVPLCPEHHTGASGLHGMGSKAFIRLYRPPGDSEFGLLVWLLEALARLNSGHPG